MFSLCTWREILIRLLHSTTSENEPFRGNERVDPSATLAMPGNWSAVSVALRSPDCPAGRRAARGRVAVTPRSPTSRAGDPVQFGRSGNDGCREGAVLATSRMLR